MEDPGSKYSGVDNLSRLPDELLSRILSLLCTEDAVRTSVLSTRWRYLCTSISNLTLKFNSEVLKNTDEQDCMNFVDRFLTHRKKCAIDKFKLKWKMSQGIDPRRLENWIEFVLGHGIRELDLCIYDFNPKDLMLPSSLFTCKTLEVLKLKIWLKEDLDDGEDFDSEACDYGLELPAEVCLPSLKSIHLRNVFFYGFDSWNKLFTNCSILEDFFFHFEQGYCILSVSSPTLKRLTLESSGDCWKKCNRFEIVVDAPNLVYLGCTNVDSSKFINTQSLVEANIDFSIYKLVCSSFFDCSINLMRGISNVQTLRMSASTIKALKAFDIPVPVLHNVTHLSIHHDFNCWFINLSYLLEKCESLETLVFENCLRVCHYELWNEVEESTISCLAFGLKTFKVYQFAGKEHEIEMLKYFLKTARALELIEVHLDSEWDNEEASEITKELQMLPRNSKARVDVF